MNKSNSPAIIVEVKLEEVPQELIVADGTLSGDLPLKLAARWRDQIMVVVNGKVVGSDVRLKIGDRVVVLPKMAGG
jgi:molybdopterin converting factor small subunit